MGRVSTRYAGLSTEQLERIEVLAQRLHEQTSARSVIVTTSGGTAIAKVGDADPEETLQSFSEKVAGRLHVQVHYGAASSLGLVRLRLRHFSEEVEKLVLTERG